jgi:hypothetical protein
VHAIGSAALQVLNQWALDISVLKKLLFFLIVILDHEPDSLKKILHVILTQLLFVGMYWGYDAWLWPCEEAMC